MTGGTDPPPPGKSQVIWVSIGNKQLDPPPPGKSWTPPLENVGPPLEPSKITDFFEIDHLASMTVDKRFIHYATNSPCEITFLM